MTTILVVDDRAVNRKLLSTVLGYADHAVLEAASAEEGIKVAEAGRPALIISDIVMPTMDGYEFVRELRTRPAVAKIPVIFCTAVYALEEARRLAEACGVSRVLVKPLDAEEIVRVVNETLAEVPTPVDLLPAEDFRREHLRTLAATLMTKVEELEASSLKRERLHEQLRQEQRRTAESLTLLQTLHAASPVGLGFVDPDLRIRHLNEPLAALAGVPLEEQLGRVLVEEVRGLWPQLAPACRKVLETGEAVLNQEAEGEHPSAPGQLHSWLASFYPVRIDDETIGVGLIAIDINEHQQAEGFQSAVMENMAEGLYATDGDGRLMLMNAAASEILGWTEDELRGEIVHDAIHYQHADGSLFPAEECELLDVSLATRPMRNPDDAFTRKDGSIVPVAYSASPLLTGSRVWGTVVVFRDISVEKADQARQRREFNALTWLGRIRDALDEDRFVLYSQPIISLTDGTQHLEELLLRMVGRDNTVIPPGSFLPTAEKYGLIGEIDRWVVTQAIQLAASGRRVAVNVSGETVGGAGLPALVERELSETAADPANVVFEITETALMHDIVAGEACARRLAGMGCGVALDDFGTGFGGFTYLKKLPVDYIKIDIEFVRELTSNAANRHVVAAIVNLAKGFGQRTIAEGVEDAETLELLRQYGVDLAQGYHLGRPAAIEAFRSHPVGRSTR